VAVEEARQAVVLLAAHLVEDAAVRVVEVEPVQRPLLVQAAEGQARALRPVAQVVEAALVRLQLLELPLLAQRLLLQRRPVQVVEAALVRLRWRRQVRLARADEAVDKLAVVVVELEPAVAEVEAVVAQPVVLFGRAPQFPAWRSSMRCWQRAPIPM
jgi:hypothetical protein